MAFMFSGTSNPFPFYLDYVNLFVGVYCVTPRVTCLMFIPLHKRVSFQLISFKFESDSTLSLRNKFKQV